MKVSILARTEARALRAAYGLLRAERLFQSSPAPRRGRYFARPFAPRARRKFQSSPAPRRGRYFARPFAPRARRKFQSSPAPRRGRYRREEDGRRPAHVSILARTEARALPRRRGRVRRPPSGFNPRPHRGAGATGIEGCLHIPLDCFNPRPHRGAGATCKGIEFYAIGSDVSILARTEARALQSVTRRSCPLMLSFNPRPHRGAGATEGLASLGVTSKVSILARTEARALRQTGRPPAQRNWFQSSPAPRRGRYGRRRDVLQHTSGFNPRPHRGAGATQSGKVASPLP